jgi:dTDP-4-dehydrorhamnose reductase
VKRYLLLGGNGQLGWELRPALAALGEVHAPEHAAFDLTDEAGMRRAIRALQPDVIVNAAGYTAVDHAEKEPALLHQVNTVAPGVIAEEAARAGALLVHFSTDYVYDGAKGTPYLEEDAPHPLNAYGKSKLAGEQAVQRAGGAHLIFRASWIYSDRGTNFVLTLLRLARERAELAMVTDQVGSPAWARTLAASAVEVLGRVADPAAVSGIYHLSAQGHVTRYAFAEEILRLVRELGVPGPWARLDPISTAQYPLPATRPLNVATSKARLERVFGVTPPAWQAQLRGFLAHSHQLHARTTTAGS